MTTIQRTDEFDSWVKGLRDTKAKAKVLVRIERLGNGNRGDVAPVGGSISEMRIDYGPGYRIYYKQNGNNIIILYGGDKSSQRADIKKAKVIEENLEE